MAYPQIHLFCVPSAGSSASIFSPWSKISTAQIKVIALEYPGHGRKAKQPLSSDPDFIADQFAQEILSYGEIPYVLFGHSVGASLIWVIEEKLKHYNIEQNLMLKVVSARPSPQFQHLIPHYAEMSDQKIIQELKRYNNFPDEILSNSDMLAFFLNIIKNDLILSDHLLDRATQKSTKALISLYGKDDPYLQNEEMMRNWHAYSTQWQGCYQLNGDHFYFRNPEILQTTLAIIQKNIELAINNTCALDSI